MFALGVSDVAKFLQQAIISLSSLETGSSSGYPGLGRTVTSTS